MATLSKYAMLSILRNLDLALADTRQADAALGFSSEGTTTWRIRLVREALLEMAIADIDVEQLEPVT